MPSNSYNNNNKSNIEFEETPVVSVNNFTLAANGSRSLGVFQVNKNCEYFKLVCGLTVNDTTLTTDSYGAVCIDYDVVYEDNDGNDARIVDGFYPKYKHENNNKEDSTIVNAPGSVKSISINVSNNEDVAVQVSDFKVYISVVAAEVTPDDVGDKLTEYYNNGGQTTLVIPLVQTLPNVNSVPDGYICRLASIT